MSFSQKRIDFLDSIIKRFYDDHYDYVVHGYNKYAGSCLVEYDDEEYTLGRRKVDNALTSITTDPRTDFDEDIEKSIFYANKYNNPADLSDQDILAIINIALFDEIRY